MSINRHEERAHLAKHVWVLRSNGGIWISNQALGFLEMIPLLF
jgi:hypothetical protein